MVVLTAEVGEGSGDAGRDEVLMKKEGAGRAGGWSVELGDQRGLGNNALGGATRGKVLVRDETRKDRLSSLQEWQRGGGLRPRLLAVPAAAHGVHPRRHRKPLRDVAARCLAWGSGVQKRWRYPRTLSAVPAYRDAPINPT